MTENRARRAVGRPLCGQLKRLLNGVAAIAETKGVFPADTRLPRSTRALLIGACSLWTALLGCGSSPWEQDVSEESINAAAEQKVSHEFFAQNASIGSWIDKRPSGSEIRHAMLVIEEPEVPAAQRQPQGRFAIISQGPELHTKITDIIADRIPIAADMKTNFALGRAVHIRIEQIDPEGKRQVIHEGSVSFLELTR